MERYIEVTGEGQYTEEAIAFIVHVSIEVRAAKDETAFRELGEVHHEAIRILREAGIREDELIEGGTDLRRPWYWKKKIGQYAARKIIIKADDFARLNDALEKLEPLQPTNRERRFITIDFQQPEFKETGEEKQQVLATAYADARAKAEHLAKAMGCRLGAPIYTSEGDWSRRNSGFSGDYDFGDYGRYRGEVTLSAAGGSGGDDYTPPVTLQKPSRTIFVKCRARFAIE